MPLGGDRLVDKSEDRLERELERVLLRLTQSGERRTGEIGAIGGKEAKLCADLERPQLLVWDLVLERS